MLTSEFDYSLPAELIAQRPVVPRDASRMMLVDRQTGNLEDRRFRELPSVLRRGDLLVFNNTRVFPARLLGRRRGVRAQKIGKHNPARREFLQAEIEVLLVEKREEDVWKVLVRPGRKVRTGEILVFGEQGLEAEVLDREPYGVRRLRFSWRGAGRSLEQEMDRLGRVPLPPYIHRAEEAADGTAYQTVFAKVRGAVAAPTAGLHFTTSLLESLRERGVQTAEITLHVGLGTFRPVRVETVEEHRMEPESFAISEAATAKIRETQRDKGRIVAVGTTCLRTLEHAAREGKGTVRPGTGRTHLFIFPGFKFQVTSALLTNFHLPGSTLLMLVSAFGGREAVRDAYRHAMEQRYRFYSYGDCMLMV